MGSYADAGDVEARLQGWLASSVPFTISTEPTLAQVDDHIDEAEAELNGVLAAQGYTSIPATGANDVKLLRKHTANEAAYQVWVTAFGGQGDVPDTVKSWHAGFAALVNRLRKGEQDLIDQTPQSDDDGVFFIVRSPVRDDTFTDRTAIESDWDE